MKKNKVAMALVLGAVSAVVAAPALLSEQSEAEKLSGSEGNLGKEESSPMAKAVIDIKKNNQVNMPEEEKAALVAEVDELLKRNVSTEDLRDSLSLVLVGYGENNLSLEQEVYNELALTFTSDSTAIRDRQPPTMESQPITQVRFCHAACHYACHGSRGWR